jgi:hypothetical protein
MKSTDPTVRLAAFRTLVAWPDATAAPQLLEFARSSADPALAVVALRDGCLRLGELEETPTEQRVTILRGVLQTAQRPEEKKRALAALAEVPSLQALEQLRACTADAALKPDAVRALASLARGIGPVYPRQTLAALESIKAQPGSPDLEKTVLEAIKAVQSSGKSPEGFIIGWRVSGPYTAPEEDAAALFDTEFPPEKGGGEWRPLAAPASGVVELGKPMPGENRTAYLQTVIESETSQEVLLELGSDDGVKAWLNGRVVHANNTTRGCAPGQDKVKVSLKQGANPLLLKITQGGGEFAACARLRSLAGGPLANVTIGPP